MRAFLLLIAGVCLVAWSVLSEPGVRFMTRISAAIGKSPAPIELNFNDLNGGMREADVQALIPQHELMCVDWPMSFREFGQQICDAKVSLVNDTTTVRMHFLFRNEKLNVVILEHTSNSFHHLASKMDATYSDAANEVYYKTTNNTLGSVMDLRGWKTKDGMLFSSSQARNPRNNVVAFWASNNYINNYSSGTFGRESGYKMALTAPIMEQ